MIPDGSDGVVDFVLGPCGSDADFFFPSYMNIPYTAKLKTTSYAPGNPGGGYINSKLSNIPSGFDVSNGHHASWNLDHQLTITNGNTYSMDVYSSLYTFYGPDFLENEQWDKVNWIMNHLDWYPGHTWEDIQGAFWLLDLQEPWNGNATGGIRNVTQLQYAQQMKTDADAYGTGFEPSWGDQAAVIFTEQGTPQGAAHPNLIIVFIEITQ